MLKKHLIAVSLLGLFSATSQAQDLTVTLTNLTQGINFTPVIAASHDMDTSIFHVAQVASAELTALAEGGSIADMATLLNTANADVIENPNSGLLGASTTTSFDLINSTGNDYLSIAAMMLPTNDGFVGLDSWEIPSEAGTYTVYLNAYDAGTEANDELIVDGSGAAGTPGIPAAPGGDAGTGGSGVTDAQSNASIHIHRGVLGDTDLSGGTSDLDSRVHRWLNPVAKLTVVVK